MSSIKKSLKVFFISSLTAIAIYALSSCGLNENFYQMENVNKLIKSTSQYNLEYKVNNNIITCKADISETSKIRAIEESLSENIKEVAENYKKSLEEKINNYQVFPTVPLERDALLKQIYTEVIRPYFENTYGWSFDEEKIHYVPAPAIGKTKSRSFYCIISHDSYIANNIYIGSTFFDCDIEELLKGIAHEAVNAKNFNIILSEKLAEGEKSITVTEEMKNELEAKAIKERKIILNYIDMDKVYDIIANF